MFLFGFCIRSWNYTLRQFGFAIGIQMLLWGLSGPWFGIAIADKYGGHKAVLVLLLFFIC